MKEHSIRDAIDSMAAVFNISDEEKQEWLPSGSARVLITGSDGRCLFKRRTA